MNSKQWLVLGAIAAFSLPGLHPLPGQVDASVRADSRPPDTVLKSLITGIKDNNLKTFLEYADSGLRLRIDQEELAKRHQLLGGKLSELRKVTYFGWMKSETYPVYFYRLELANSDTDLVMKLIMRRGSVTGIWIHEPAGKMNLPEDVKRQYSRKPR